jgi:RHS repeat-associated protein
MYDTPSNLSSLYILSGPHFTGKERDQESGLDYFGARYYGSTMGRFLSPDSAADEVLSVPIPFADLKNPQSLNLYSYVGNNPLSRVDPDGHDYTVCATGQPCVHLTDQQYYDAIHGAGNNGINAPPFGQSGNITCGGAVCGTASYMDQGAINDLSGGQLMGIAGGKALGAMFGLVGEAVGRLFGSTAGEAAGQGAKVLLQAGTKQAAKDVVEGPADSAQKATLKRSIARATTKEAISIKQLSDGSFEVVKTRPGFDGSQSFTTNIGKDGSSVTVQTAVDSTGTQVHYDPK